MLWQVAYLLLPLPIGLAWFRWASERRAYLVQLRAGASVDATVETLWSRYGWCWPRPWMRTCAITRSGYRETAPRHVPEP